MSLLLARLLRTRLTVEGLGENVEMLGDAEGWTTTVVVEDEQATARTDNPSSSPRAGRMTGARIPKLSGESWGNDKGPGRIRPLGAFEFLQVVECRRGDLNPHAPQGALGPQPSASTKFRHSDVAPGILPTAFGPAARARPA